MVSKDSITLGLSSASIAATESQFCMSSSSSRLLSPIVPSVAVSSPSARSSVGLNGVAGAMASACICGGRPGGAGGGTPPAQWPPGVARGGNARDQLAVGVNHRRRHDIDVRAGIGCIEVDDVAQEDLALVELVPPDNDGLESERAFAKPPDHGLAAGLDTLGDGDLALARKQLHRAHFTEINAHGVVGALGGILGRGFDRNGSLLNLG